MTDENIFGQRIGLLTNQKTTKNGSAFIDVSYDYTRNNAVGSLNGKTGHLTKITDNLNSSKNREYEFDVLGRLTKAKGGNGGALWNQQYSYDRYGNRTNVTASGVAADSSPIPIDGIPNLAYDNSTNRITTTGFQYDVNGNMIRSLAEDGVTWVKYEYDAANRLNIVRRDSDQVQLERLLGLGPGPPPTVRDSYPPFDPVSCVSWSRFRFRRRGSARKQALHKEFLLQFGKF